MVTQSCRWYGSAMTSKTCSGGTAMSIYGTTHIEDSTFSGARGIRRNDGLVEMIGFLGGRVQHLGSVAGVVEKREVARRGRIDEHRLEGASNPFIGGLTVGEDGNVLPLETEARHEDFFHCLRVVHRARQVCAKNVSMLTNFLRDPLAGDAFGLADAHRSLFKHF